MNEEQRAIVAATPSTRTPNSRATSPHGTRKRWANKNSANSSTRPSPAAPWILHDRSVVNGSKRGNIDHLIVASSGIWVVDAKKYSSLVDVRTEGVWKWKTSDLFVGRRNQSKLIDSMGWQSAAVQSLLEPMGMGAVPVHPALCFVHSEWARHPNAAVVDGVLVLSPDKLFSVASQPGWVEPDAINAIANQLSSGLPAAAKR